ncbi:MAG: hypothetical protein AAB659_01905 [Patescibacteria group bacterium]
MKISVLFVASLVLLVFALLFTSIHFYGIGGLVILHFDSAGRADLVGEIGNVFNVIGIATVIVLLNWILSWRLYLKDKIFTYVFASISLAVSLIALTAVYLISVIN